MESNDDFSSSRSLSGVDPSTHYSSIKRRRVGATHLHRAGAQRGQTRWGRRPIACDPSAAEPSSRRYFAEKHCCWASDVAADPRRSLDCSSS